jgi:hypothetical protein
MYDCNIACLGPGCDFWRDCEKCADIVTTSPQLPQKN